MRISLGALRHETRMISGLARATAKITPVIGLVPTGGPVVIFAQNIGQGESRQAENGSRAGFAMATRRVTSARRFLAPLPARFAVLRD